MKEFDPSDIPKDEFVELKVKESVPSDTVKVSPELTVIVGVVAVQVQSPDVDKVVNPDTAPAVETDQFVPLVKVSEVDATAFPSDIAEVPSSRLNQLLVPSQILKSPVFVPSPISMSKLAETASKVRAPSAEVMSMVFPPW